MSQGSQLAAGKPKNTTRHQLNFSALQLHRKFSYASFPKGGIDQYSETDHVKLSSQLEEQHGLAPAIQPDDGVRPLSAEGPFTERSIAEAAGILQVHYFH